MNLPWWREAVVYQIYPRSFCSTGSGSSAVVGADGVGESVGDLEGVRRHLDHLAWLGVDAIWLSPFYPSPMADFGYDVSDYCGVDPLFGTLEDFDLLVAETHARGMRILVDWVPNHTSDRHPWFQAARSSRDDPRRHWYWWRDDRPDEDGGHGPPGGPGRLPNNWQQAFPGVGQRQLPPAWTWDPETSQWYLHFFLPEQPDLRWANPEVRSAMAGTLRFWMDRGVDGFRVDVVQGLGKDPRLPDIPDADQPPSGTNDRPETHVIVAELRQVIDSQPGPRPRMMVGEVYLPTTAQVATYYGTPEQPELHLSFNFPPLLAPWDAAAWKEQVDRVVDLLDPLDAWPTWVLSNHDQRRHRTRYGNEARARAAAVLLLTLRGTPFLYAGEELGLEDAEVPADRRVDPGGRDGCRAPIPWDATPEHGWAGGPPWLPWPPGAGGDRNVASQLDDRRSILHLYRRLLAARRASPALVGGDFGWVEAPEGTLGWERRSGAGVTPAAAGAGGGGAAGGGAGATAGGGAEGAGGAAGAGWAEGAGGVDRRLVYVDFTGAGARVRLPAGRWTVEVETTGAGEGDVVEGALALEPDGGVVLRPA